MSAKPVKKAAKKAAVKKVSKPAAKVAKPAPAKKAAKAATKPALATVVEDGTEVVFIGFASPVEGVSELNIGDKLFIFDRNEDDGSYNVSRTAKSKPIDTLFRQEFRLASESASKDEVANTGKNGGAPLSAKTKAAVKETVAKTSKKTDAEADNGSKKSKDKEGRTVKKVEAKKEKAKPAKVEEPVGPVTLLPSVKALVKESEGDLIRAAELLTDRSGATDYSLGGILGKIEETAAFENIKDDEGQPKYGTGHKGFSKFVEDHLGMKYRKARYLITNYVTAVNCGITEKQLAGIGWSKLKEAVAVLTEDNKDEIIAEAKAMPFENFKAAMKKRLVNGGGKQHGNSKAELVTFTFRLHNDKATVATEALNKAKATLGIEGNDVGTNSMALDHILSEWMTYQEA